MKYLKLLLIILSLNVAKQEALRRKTGSSNEISQDRSQNLRLRKTADLSDTSTGVHSTLLQTLITKAHQRQPINMLVIGGSNTAGGGLQHKNEIYFNIITDWWNKEISQTTGSKLTSHKMAIGGTGSDFFSFCFQNFLPKEQPDIVLVELSVNDYGYKYGEASKPMEILTRRLLSLPSKPLVMYVHLVDRGLLDNEITNTGCANMEDLGFTELAEHYDIPSFSWRDFLCPKTSSGERQKMNTATNMFNTDGSHVGTKAHAQLASKVISYIREGFASYSAGRRRSVDEDDLKDDSRSVVEPVFIDSSISDAELAHSQCLSFLTPNWKTPLIQSLTFKVTHSKNFRFVSPAASKKSSNHKPFRTDAYGSWASKSKTGLLKIRFLISDKGPSSRSIAVIFRSKDNHASTEIWLDDDKNSAITVDSNKCGHHMYQTRLEPLATGISPGYHTLNVASKGGGWFEISGIVVGYTSYHGYEGYRPFDVKAKMWNEENFKKLHC